jgi:hypothetical protein
MLEHRRIKLEATALEDTPLPHLASAHLPLGDRAAPSQAEVSVAP